MKKKVVSLILVLVFVFSTFTMVHASTPSRETIGERVPVSEINQMELATEVISILEDIDLGIDISFFPLDQSTHSRYDAHMHDLNMPDELLEFDSLYEFELFLRSFIQYIEIAHGHTIDASGASDLANMNNVTTTSSRLESWWAPNIIGGVFVWYNISYIWAIENTNPSRALVTVVNSWVTGVSNATWTHRHGSVFFTNPFVPALISATGTWFIGVNVYGIPLGATFNATWERMVWP